MAGKHCSECLLSVSICVHRWLTLLFLVNLAQGASPGNAPPLPVAGTRLVNSNLVTAVPGMFANAAVGDLHLLASATNAIDKALTLSTVTNDFDGEPRPRGARSDIGADEFTTNAPPSLSGVKVSGPNAIVGILTFLGESYHLLRANDLAGSAWTAIATNLPGSGGVISITDANGASQSRGFYRSRLSP